MLFPRAKTWTSASSGSSASASLKTSSSASFSPDADCSWKRSIFCCVSESTNQPSISSNTSVSGPSVLVPLLDHPPERVRVLRLRQRDHVRPVVRQVEPDEVDLVAESRLDVLLVVEARLLLEGRAERRERLGADRELPKELVDLLPLVGARDWSRSRRRPARSPRRAPRRRSRLPASSPRSRRRRGRERRAGRCGSGALTHSIRRSAAGP